MEVVCIPWRFYVFQFMGKRDRCVHQPHCKRSVPLETPNTSGAPQLLRPTPRALTVLADPGILLPGCDFMDLRLLLFLAL